MRTRARTAQAAGRAGASPSGACAAPEGSIAPRAGTPRRTHAIIAINTQNPPGNEIATRVIRLGQGHHGGQTRILDVGNGVRNCGAVSETIPRPPVLVMGQGRSGADTEGTNDAFTAKRATVPLRPRRDETRE